MAAAEDAKIELSQIYKALETSSAEKLKAGLMPRSFEYSVMEMLFSAAGGESPAGELEPIQTLEPEKVRELFQVLCAPHFEEKHKVRLRYYIEVWELKGLLACIWEKGLIEYFNERFSKPDSSTGKLLPIEEILEKSSPAEILEESMLIGNFVFDQTGDSQLQEGLKEGLYLEQHSRETATALLEKLYGLFTERPLDYEKIRKAMLELHMERRIDLIEKAGMAALHRFIRENWRLGAQETARRHNFNLPRETETQSGGVTVLQVNLALLGQAPGSESGKTFLRREALLGLGQPLHSGHCHDLGGGYLLLSVSPVEEQEHYFFGQYGTEKEKGEFISRFLKHYFSSGNLRAAANGLTGQYLEELSGNIRLKNAVRIAVLALPVVLLVAALVAWFYKLTQEHSGESFLIGAALTLLGETIAARNGYGMKVKPESHEKIPGYALREEGVLKFRDTGCKPPGA